LADLNSLEALAKPEPSPIRQARRDGMPAELEGNLDTDLRVVIATNHPEHVLDVWVDEPSGHTCRRDSPCGGELVTLRGISEYMMRRALPGKYTIRCRASVALTVHATLYRDWGRAIQTRQDATIQLEGGDEQVTLAEYDFRFVE
jgi:hypothetical protein